MGNVKQSMAIVAGLAGLVLSAAGCAGPAPSAPSTPGPSTAASAPSGDGATGQPDAGSGTGAANTDSGSSGSGAGRASSRPAGAAGGRAGTPECRTSDLQVADEAGTGQNAGTHTEKLLFRNTATRTCFLEGYPGVSFVTAGGGKQLGRGFIRDGGATPRVLLKPGGQAHAIIEVTYAPNACAPAKAGGYHVIPPDQYSSLFVSKPQYACTETGQADGHVEPIGAGA
ncbi:DUF4232 domain-containing protein [Actinoplanes sp. NPDC048796]|uniref:DUF4232 domain-containing protein n=1 Tax=Actinoplanes sp. NPDC048796 TaxID=3155640 RepID=UPI0033FBFD88